jgi:acetyl-CoA synthetase
MSEHKVYAVPAVVAKHALVNHEDYARMYEASIAQPEKFWPAQANQFLSWSKPWHTLSESDLPRGKTAWFIGGQLNACYNCLDRHLPDRAEQTAIIWEGDDPSDTANITYAAAHDKVCRLANVLKARGVNKGDRVCIYMPMIPEAAYAMLACARIGAIHSVVFGGFSPQALQDRILDADCRTVITADEGVRAGRSVPLKRIPTRHWKAAPPSVPSLSCNARGLTSLGTMAAISIMKHRLTPQTHTAMLFPWIVRTHYLSSTLPVQPANRKAFCIPPAAICCKLP